LEYGEAIIEMHKGFIQPNQRVLIHDDLLATGGTALAASELIRQQQGIVEQYSFLVELSFLKGQELLKTVSNQIDSLVIY
jgi:adenine phosphoribosyltransferase